MKILSFFAENVKKLTVVEITPDGNLVQITGRNASGKSSVLDAIMMAIAGAEHIQTVPIRRGATEAVIRLDLGEIKVSRTFKQRVDADGFTSAITVSQANGARFPSPQAMLDSLLGELSFDPLAFTRMKSGEQLDILKRFVPGVDFAEIAVADKADYDARTIVNRDAKRVRAQRVGISFPANTPDEPVDEKALLMEMRVAGDVNTDIEKRRSALEAVRAGIAVARRRAEERMARADELRRQAALEENDANRLKAIADTDEVALNAEPALPPAVDVEAIRTRIEAARSVNAAVAAKRQAAALEAEAKGYETEAAAYTKAMTERAEQKRKAITDAAIPVPGMGFGDDGVTLNGLPFDQASDAEQLRASVALAAAMNPKLRVIRVRDGSLLDSDGIRMLAAFADEHDLQVWLERATDGAPIGFVLEDGHLKAAATEKEAAE